jgi:hypothetical protein
MGSSIVTMVSGNYSGAQENTDPRFGRNCQKTSEFGLEMAGKLHSAHAPDLNPIPTLTPTPSAPSMEIKIAMKSRSQNPPPPHSSLAPAAGAFVG